MTMLMGGGLLGVLCGPPAGAPGLPLCVVVVNGTSLAATGDVRIRVHPKHHPKKRDTSAVATIAEMPLVEREAEIAALADVTAACAAGGGRLLAIEGPAGIGKTRLVAAARDAARAGGLTVLSARGGGDAAGEAERT